MNESRVWWSPCNSRSAGIAHEDVALCAVLDIQPAVDGSGGRSDRGNGSVVTVMMVAVATAMVVASGDHGITGVGWHCSCHWW